jgi:hypothetical protein
MNESHRQAFEADLFVYCEQYMQAETTKFSFKSIRVHGKPIVDLKIFQSLRMLYCHKMKDPKRPLVPKPPPKDSRTGKVCDFSLELLQKSMVTWFPCDQRHLIFSYPVCFYDDSKTLLAIYGAGNGGPKTSSTAGRTTTSTNTTEEPFDKIPPFPRYDELYRLLYDMIREIYDKAGLVSIEISLSDHIKLSEKKDRLLIGIRKGPCLMKWFHTEKRVHSHPNGLGFFVSLYPSIHPETGDLMSPMMMLGCKKGCLQKYSSGSSGSDYIKTKQQQQQPDTATLETSALLSKLTKFDLFSTISDRDSNASKKLKSSYKSIYPVPTEYLEKIHNILRDAKLIGSERSSPK